MAHSMRLTREGSTLVVVDVQERLFAAMDAEHREEVVRNLKVLAATARRLSLPIVVTEQYPKGLGHTLPELREALGPIEPLEKVTFSCCDTEGFSARLKAAKTRQVILVGIEAHVCVLMTGLDLLAEGFAVHLAADAVTSRTQGNWRIGVEQLRQAGAVITGTESVLFQLLQKADTDDFRALVKLIK